MSEQKARNENFNDLILYTNPEVTDYNLNEIELIPSKNGNPWNVTLICKITDTKITLRDAFAKHVAFVGEPRSEFKTKSDYLRRLHSRFCNRAFRISVPRSKTILKSVRDAIAGNSAKVMPNYSSTLTFNLVLNWRFIAFETKPDR